MMRLGLKKKKHSLAFLPCIRLLLFYFFGTQDEVFLEKYHSIQKQECKKLHSVEAIGLSHYDLFSFVEEM